jgi:Na+:H+ antiporter, NhaA family
VPMSRFREFLQEESAGGVLLAVATVLALIASNSPAEPLYDTFLETRVEIRIGQLLLAKPLLLWINDGLMAVFFLLIGLELKRELLKGELSQPAQAVLPAIAALGGMLAPALVFSALNWHDPAAMRGWAIPTATDIAFALGVLSLLGPRVPPSLKVFLTAVAIFDDLGAIVIIAAFYTDNLSFASLLGAAAATVVLAGLNVAGVTRRAPYILVGIVLWVCVLKSGVHATLAGVVLALAIPLRARDAEGHVPLTRLEHQLHPWVAFGIMPIFAFANAGVSLAGMGLASLIGPIPLGIAGGLFLGKQIGIFGAVWLATKSGLARPPAGARWAQIYGVALLAGIGFTMSLFIGTLAYDDPTYGNATRFGVLGGSLLSGLVGYALLRLGSRR